MLIDLITSCILAAF